MRVEIVGNTAALIRKYLKLGYDESKDYNATHAALEALFLCPQLAEDPEIAASLVDITRNAPIGYANYAANILRECNFSGVDWIATCLSLVRHPETGNLIGKGSGHDKSHLLKYSGSISERCFDSIVDAILEFPEACWQAELLTVFPHPLLRSRMPKLLERGGLIATQAAYALAHCGDEAGRRFLEQTLSDDDHPCLGIWALPKIADEHTLPLLRAFMSRTKSRAEAADPGTSDSFREMRLRSPLRFCEAALGPGSAESLPALFNELFAVAPGKVPIPLEVSLDQFRRYPDHQKAKFDLALRSANEDVFSWRWGRSISSVFGVDACFEFLQENDRKALASQQAANVARYISEMGVEEISNANAIEPFIAGPCFPYLMFVLADGTQLMKKHNLELKTEVSKTDLVSWSTNWLIDPAKYRYGEKHLNLQ